MVIDTLLGGSALEPSASNRKIDLPALQVLRFFILGTRRGGPTKFLSGTQPRGAPQCLHTKKTANNANPNGCRRLEESVPHCTQLQWLARDGEPDDDRSG